MTEKEGIDLVYLWVDGSDPTLRQRRNEAMGITENLADANCEGRYADNDELRYSLRSAEQYAPWIRKIFIVTDRQTPRWLDTSNDKIRIIDHTEIMPPEILPTFNSVTIEHALHRIPGLSEFFLYANDDMFFNRPVSPGDFFTSEGKPIVRLNRRMFRSFTLWVENHLLGKTLSTYNKTILHAGHIVEARTGRFVPHKPHHNIDAYRKSLYRQTFEALKDDIEPTLSNRFRSDSDVQRAVYSYFPLARGEAKLKFVGQSKSFRLHTHRHGEYGRLECLKPLLFCLNDSQFAGDSDREFMRRWLESRFPEPSSFELKPE